MSCARDSQISNFDKFEVRNKIAITHLLYTMTIIFNLVVVVMYWGIIHNETIEKHIKDGPPMKVYLQYMIHIIPAFSCLVNCFITNIAL